MAVYLHRNLITESIRGIHFCSHLHGALFFVLASCTCFQATACHCYMGICCICLYIMWEDLAEYSVIECPFYDWKHHTFFPSSCVVWQPWNWSFQSIYNVLRFVSSVVVSESIPWLKWLVFGLTADLRFHHRPTCVGFVVDRVTLWQFGLWILWFSHVSIIP